jgi:ankyrin repeat protein
LDNMAIHASIAGNYEHVVNMLIRHHADVNAKCEGKWRPGFTPLHVAGYFGRASIVQLLLDHGADKTFVNDAGPSAYEAAISRGHPETVVLLK